ncbi:putative membrane protein [Rhodobacter aestuarii]|uniref:Putative membrane protein n=1 Tax=Rhodobacter aestuarii TaxID=453582 RepID=A0A1N7Q550_9RHOB|nr:TIGR01620 family protein [Rhodobacter aestuarii]PTV93893.1 putative membrane protein [Rhodobacter aestuarii]SIT17936.1 putative membrane protein [Rhodobacter aestuarii]
MKRPIMIELDAPPASPAEAPPVVDVPAAQEMPQGRAMQIAARLAARPRSKITRFFWQATTALLGFLITIAAWQFVDGLFAANPILGWVATVLLGVFLFAAFLVTMREVAAFARLGRLDKIQHEVAEAVQNDRLEGARSVVKRLQKLYAGREDLQWALSKLKERGPEQLDTSTLILMAETELMGPLDAAARLEVEAAARTVGTITAIVPLALADVATALIANIRMIRRVAEIYGGRAGALGAIRLARTVMTHLVATGAVAAGDDLIDTVAGGHVAAKLSRRFGEGVVNGALTARVGIAAMEVCRPMPFAALPRPKVRSLTGRALSGVFSKSKDD